MSARKCAVPRSQYHRLDLRRVVYRPRARHRMLETHFDRDRELVRDVEQFKGVPSTIGAKVCDHAPEGRLIADLSENFRSAIFPQVGVLFDQFQLSVEYW